VWRSRSHCAVGVWQALKQRWLRRRKSFGEMELYKQELPRD
jgi:hypothetical protein